MTVVATVKALLDPILGGRVYRDEHPEDPNVAWPYANVRDDVSRNPAVRGDQRTVAWTRLVQVDVWQRAEAEDDGLLDTVLAALDGAEPPGRDLLIQVDASQRLYEPEARIVHHAVTLRVATLT